MENKSVLRYRITKMKENEYNILRDLDSEDKFYDLVQLNITGQDGRKHVMVIEFPTSNRMTIAFLDQDMQFVRTHAPGFRYDIVDRDNNA